MTAQERVGERTIGGLGAFALVAGSMLGVGIFLAPPVVAQEVRSSGLFLLLWGLGGLVALAGAVACAELGTLLPRSGGDYVFQRAAFGPSAAFASGWVLFVAIFSGSLAALAVALAKYQLPVLLGVSMEQPLFPGLGLTVIEATACALVLSLTLVNLAGARPAAAVQATSTLLPLVVFLGLAVLALVALPPASAAATATTTVGVATSQPVTASGLARSYNAIHFAFSGWINVIYVAGEVRRPGRTIPRALLAGTVTVTALYLVICLAFVVGLGMPGLAEAGEAGSELAERLGGRPLRWVMTACIAVAIVASLNATVLGGARILQAMAADGAALGWFARRTPAGSPARALWAQAGWSGVLICSGGFEALLQMVSVAMVVTGSLTVGSLFVLRHRDRSARPFRATGYPWFPAVYLLASAAVLVVMVQSCLAGGRAEWLPLLGLVVAVAAFAGHRLLQRRRVRREVAGVGSDTVHARRPPT